MTGELIMSVTYGIDVQPSNDPYIDLAERALHSLVAAVVPGAFLVDSIPLRTSCSSSHCYLFSDVVS